MFISSISKNYFKFDISNFANYSNKILSFGVLSVLSALSIFQSNVSVSAGDESLYKGQKADFVVEYANIGDAIATDALLTTKIGDKFEVDTSSFTDQYGDGQIYCVNPSVFTADKNVVGAWGGIITYRPRSAETNDISTCKGVSTPGTVDLGLVTNGNAKKGYFRFKATLKSDITDPIGTVLTQVSNQGTLSTLVLDKKRQPVITADSITIIANPKPVRSNFAKPDDNKKTGGDFDGTKPQPIYSGMVFDPNPGITKAKFKITTTGLLDSATSETLENATCQTILKNSNYNFTANGTVTGGNCVVNLLENETPTAIGDYQAVTKVKGPNGDLWTKPENVIFGQVVQPRSNLAKPDDNKKTGGDFDGTKPQPIYSGMIFDPNPGITKQIFKITTSGLIDSGNGASLENATCQTTLKGQNYQFTASGNVANGICIVNFTANETPTAIGDYQAVTRIKGPNGDLWTKPENVKFDEIVKAVNITVRTGGENLMIGTGIVMFIIGTAYYLSKKQKMQY